MQVSIGFVERVYQCLSGGYISSKLEMTDTILRFGTFRGRTQEAIKFSTRWGEGTNHKDINLNLDLTPYGMGSYLSSSIRGKFTSNLRGHLMTLDVKTLRYLYHLAKTKGEAFNTKSIRGNHYDVGVEELYETGFVMPSYRFRILQWDKAIYKTIRGMELEWPLMEMALKGKSKLPYPNHLRG